MPKIWDMAGKDALAVAQQLFGHQVGYLSPFQSVETVREGQACSVLRLCNCNFRISCADALDQQVATHQRGVWIKQYGWLSTLSLPIEQLSALTKTATTRAPHRLQNLPNNQAVPASFKGIPVLIWRHPIQGEPAVELHVAATDRIRLLEQLKSLSQPPPTLETVKTVS